MIKVDTLTHFRIWLCRKVDLQHCNGLKIHSGTYYTNIMGGDGMFEGEGKKNEKEGREKGEKINNKSRIKCLKNQG